MSIHGHTNTNLRPIDIADAIACTSESCSEALLSAGWDGDGSGYHLYTFHAAMLAELIHVGHEERVRLETAIRERLDAAHAAASEV